MRSLPLHLGWNQNTDCLCPVSLKGLDSVVLGLRSKRSKRTHVKRLDRARDVLRSLFRSGCERIHIHGQFRQDMVSRSAQAPGHSAAVGLRSSLVNSLPADGDVCLACVAAANSRQCAVGIDPVHDSIVPQRTLVFSLFRFAKPRSGAGRNRGVVGRHRPDRDAIRGILTPRLLADHALWRMGALCFIPEPRNLAPQ